MAQITRYPFARHLRAEANAYVLHFRRGRQVRAGRGLSFFFLPHAASVAEVPVDDRELVIAFRGRSADYQDVAVQGVLTYRVVDPALLAERVDFTLDLRTGALLQQPLEKLALLFSGVAEQHARAWIAATPVRQVLAEGFDAIRARIEAAFAAEPAFRRLGLEPVAVRVASVRPVPELEKALEAPARERIQQQADEAAFARRALAVEKERAIQENELQNQIELARRQEALIAQRGQNARREASDAAEAARIAAEGAAERTTVEARAEAEASRVKGEARAASLRLVEEVRTTSEGARLAAAREVPPAALFALAAQALAGKLDRIEHLNLGEAALGPALARLLEAGAARAEAR